MSVAVLHLKHKILPFQKERSIALVSMTVVSGTLIKEVIHPLTPLSICVDFLLVRGVFFVFLF